MKYRLVRQLEAWGALLLEAPATGQLSVQMICGSHGMYGHHVALTDEDVRDLDEGAFDAKRFVQEVCSDTIQRDVLPAASIDGDFERVADTRSLMQDLAVVLYYISARSKVEPITAELVRDHQKKICRSPKWLNERERAVGAIRESLEIPDFPYEAVHVSRAYSRADLRRFLELLLDCLDDDDA